MKKNYLLLLVMTFLCVTNIEAQTAFAGWNFDAQTIAASSGTGTLSFVGGTGPDTYINNSGTQALAFANFPLATVGSGTAGIKFTTSTVGKIGISISFDTYGHNQSSKYQQYEYTTDGTTWTVLSTNELSPLTSNFVTKTLNFPATCDNNPNFAFRIVSIFGSGNTEYQQVQGGGYNGNNGKWYFDNVSMRYASLGLQENNIANLKIYPNPAKTSLFITSDSFAAKNVEIYNVVGAKVMTTQITNTPINVSGLKTGIYMVKVTEEGKTATRKLTIE